jgi:hypothetical protein
MTLSQHLLWIGPVLLLAGAGRLTAQVERLPTVMPPSQPYRARLAMHPDSPAELPQPLPDFPPREDRFLPGQLDFSPNLPDPSGQTPPDRLWIEPPGSPPPVVETNPDRPADARDGFFQKLMLTSAWLDADGSRGLGITELDLRMVAALPIPSRKVPMILTPGLTTYFLQWPDSPDLPAQLYDAFIQFRWFWRVHPRLAFDMAITPGVYSDFEQGTDEAIRLPGHGAAVWDLNPAVRLVAGVGYFDRLDVKLLPIGGLILTPHEDVKYELLFPTPKIAHRVRWHGADTEQIQDWVYLKGEFGGSTWAIRRASGANDRLNYRDFRVLLGIERKAIGLLDYSFEVGYVFNREFQYASSTIDIEPSDTVMLRGGLTY